VIVLINCSVEKNQGLWMFTAYENTFYFALFIVFSNFLVTDADLPVTLALDTSAIPPVIQISA